MTRNALPSRPVFDLVARCLRALACPSRPNLLALAEASWGQWESGLILLWASSIIILALAARGSGAVLCFSDFLTFPLAMTVLGAAFAGGVQTLADRVAGKGGSLFDFVLVLSSAGFLVLQPASLLAALLPGATALLSAAAFLYWLVLVVLGTRAVANVSLGKAAAITGLALPLALVAAFVMVRIIVGMPGLFERGTLLW